MNNMKKCNRCDLEKTLECFSIDKSKSDGLRTLCRECSNLQKRSAFKKQYEVSITEAKCHVCEITKTVDNFNRNKFKVGGIEPRCKDCRSKETLKYYENNKEVIKDKANTYYHNNKTNPKLRETRRKYQKHKMQTDPKYVLTRRLRARLYSALEVKSWKKTTHFYEYIGCSLDELKLHIETQFVEGMTWENKGLWEIDHVIPLSSAQTSEDLYKLCHYTNLQPLWEDLNRSKGANIPVILDQSKKSN